MKTFQCAFVGTVGREAEVVETRNGRRFLKIAVLARMGENERGEWVDVAAWSDHFLALAPSLTKGVEVYVEGSLKLRTMDGVTVMSVSASDFKPMGLIGQRKPKAARANGAKKSSTVAGAQAPIQFADGTDADVGDEMPF